MEAELIINRNIRDGICYFEFKGALDSPKISQLHSELNAAIGEGHTKIICDVSTARPISSAALGTLYTKQKEINAQGGKIILVGRDRATLQMLAILNASKLFQIVNNTEDALQYFPA